MLSSTELLGALMDFHFPGECKRDDWPKVDLKQLFWRKSKRWLAFVKGRPYRSARVVHDFGSHYYIAPSTYRLSYKAGRLAWLEQRAGEVTIQIYNISTGHCMEVFGKNREVFTCISLADSMVAGLTLNK